MRTINKIIIHCSATPADFRFTAADITRWHQARGFKTIGYHYVILIDGRIEKGRPEWQTGAHCQGHNDDSIGVCYIGGLDALSLQPRDTRSATQKATMRRLISQLLARYPDATVYGHRDFARRDCPCFDAKEEYRR